MRTLLQDLRYASRQLLTSRGVAFLAIITLALGVGANMALYTVVESVLLRPLPYAHPDRLVLITPDETKAGFQSTSWLNYRDIRDQSRSLAATAAYATDLSVIVGKSGSESLIAPRVTPNVFSMLGVHPLLGRTFTEEEGRTGGPQVALLSEQRWRQSFNADPNIIGQTVDIGGVGRTIVGVMPSTFRFPEEDGAQIRKAVWLPLQPTEEMLSERGYHFISIIGQMRPDVTRAKLQSELNAIAKHIKDSDPKSSSSQVFHAWPYQEVITGPIRPVFYTLFGALALVMIIACANVTNLMIARCLGRRQEFAVRSALGANRLRLVRQMLTEGLLLSLLGCGIGMLLAKLALGAVTKLPDDTIPRANAIAIHWTILLALVAVATITTVLSSLLPALLVARTDPQPALQAGSRGVGSRSINRQLSGWLVAGEVALSTLLLIGTGLLFHTLWNLEHARLGFDVAHVTTFSAMPSDTAGFTGMAVSQDTAHAPISVASLVYAPVLDRIRQAPGVESAALVTAPPLSGVDMHSSFEIIGDPKDPSKKPETRVSAVSGEYAQTMGTPILRGRMISDNDTASSPYVVVINDALAKKYFQGRDPLQRQIDLGGKDTGMITPYTIVGVLADQSDNSVGGKIQPFVLIPAQQVPTTSLFYQALLKTIVNFVVRTRGDLSVAQEMRSIFQQTAPGYALDDFQTMQEVVDQHTFSQRLGLYLIGSFAVLAIVMVIAGLYGVLAQIVSYRRREIGIRIALGATRQSVAQMVLRQGAVLIGAGLGIGIVLALVAGRLIKSFLYEVQPSDKLTYLSVALLLLLIGSLASAFPAHRAASIEPMQALRED